MPCIERRPYAQNTKAQDELSSLRGIRADIDKKEQYKDKVLDTALPSPLNDKTCHPEYRYDRIDNECPIIMTLISLIDRKCICAKAQGAGSDRRESAVAAEYDQKNKEVYTHQDRIDPDDV